MPNEAPTILAYDTLGKISTRNRRIRKALVCEDQDVIRRSLHPRAKASLLRSTYTDATGGGSKHYFAIVDILSSFQSSIGQDIAPYRPAALPVHLDIASAIAHDIFEKSAGNERIFSICSKATSVDAGLAYFEAAGIINIGHAGYDNRLHELRDNFRRIVVQATDLEADDYRQFLNRCMAALGLGAH